MKYPKIYSLSTVGLVKHYNHDYLFHHRRTDFIGPNGVGKSILADLMQMMFIFDTELIKFGTVDLREKRYIHTLPYQTNFGYSFLNIAISDKHFLTVGIQISKLPGKRIIPFVISKDADLAKDIHLLALEADEVLFAKDIVSKGVIPDFADLANYLNKERNLKLQYFKTKEDVQRYYRFLYDKKILPINLSLEKSKKAYAKVIQSFSKAQSLKLGKDNASKELKEFLFEEANDDILKTFESEKASLEMILHEYNRLNSGIKILKHKQSSLVDLSHMSQEVERMYNSFRLDEICDVGYSLIELKKSKEDNIYHCGSLEGSLKKHNVLEGKIPGLEKRIDSSFKEADNNYREMYRYRELKENLTRIENEISKLAALHLPDIDEGWEIIDAIDISVISVATITESLEFAKPLLDTYGSLAKIEEAREQQFKQTGVLRNQLEAQQQKAIDTIELLKRGGNGTLLEWYVNNKPDLKGNQIQAILHFSTLPVSQKPDPVFGDKYIDSNNVSEFNISETQDGLWLKFGPVSEFIKFDPNAALLEDTQNFKNNIQQIVERLEVELQIIRRKLVGLNRIKDGHSYDESLFDTVFDPRISERSTIDQLRQAVSYLLLYHVKVSLLVKQKKELKTAISEQLLKFKIVVTDPELVEEKLKLIRDVWFIRSNRINAFRETVKGKIELIRKDLETAKSSLEDLEVSLEIRQIGYDSLINAYTEDYGIELPEMPLEKKDVVTSKNNHAVAFDNYKKNYIATVSDFIETQKRGSVEVNHELDSNSYSFAVLERALLGEHIKTTDDIANALQDANNNRTQIADSIRHNMLKIFNRITEDFKKYKLQVQDINSFFIGRKISDKYYFNVDFSPNDDIKIKYIEDLAYEIRLAANSGELQFDQPITEFLENFFKNLAQLKETVPIRKLLDPKTYFDLSAKLEDESQNEVSGSTGESYSAVALLGVARLSNKKTEEQGLRFIILEELGSIDNTNFNIFPEIAEEFNYQILTMAPHAFNIGLSEDWYAHHMIKGTGNGDINYYPSASYFKTKSQSEDLDVYINRF